MYGFRFYFTPLTGVLFTFPSRYWCTIGHQVVFSLGRWSSRIPTGFLGPRSTQDLHSTSQGIFVYGALTPYGRPFQAFRLSDRFVDSVRRPYNPVPVGTVWAVPRSLAATRRIISFPRGTEMFQFPRFPPSGLCVQPVVIRDESDRVTPFGDPRVSLLDS